MAFLMPIGCRAFQLVFNFCPQTQVTAVPEVVTIVNRCASLLKPSKTLSCARFAETVPLIVNAPIRSKPTPVGDGSDPDCRNPGVQRLLKPVPFAGHPLQPDSFPVIRGARIFPPD